MSVWRRILTTFPVHDRFWQNADQLVAEHDVIIDRPAGSHHPRFPEICYPLDYGCLAGTTGGDGQGIDVWFGTLPGVRVTGAIMTIDLRKKDAEVKLLVSCTPAEMESALKTHNYSYQGGVLLVRS